MYDLTNYSSDEDSAWEEDNSGLTIAEDEDDNTVIVKAAIPGVDSKDVDVSLDDRGVLTITAETVEEEKDKKRKYYRKAESSFCYRVALPENVDEKKEPEAVCKDGVITLTFQKILESKPKKIAVKKG